jgi:hypothetical protein
MPFLEVDTLRGPVQVAITPAFASELEDYIETAYAYYLQISRRRALITGTSRISFVFCSGEMITLLRYQNTGRSVILCLRFIIAHPHDIS